MSYRREFSDNYNNINGLCDIAPAGAISKTVLHIRQQIGSPRWKVPAHSSRPALTKETSMSRALHIAAAAKQLNRKLFDSTHLEGSVTVGHDQLDVVVHGTWTRNKLGNYAGYTINWRELPVAA
jgi:hypothetical protein